eukprot:Awhi_evm2s1438
MEISTGDKESFSYEKKKINEYLLESLKNLSFDLYQKWVTDNKPKFPWIAEMETDFTNKANQKGFFKTLFQLINVQSLFTIQDYSKALIFERPENLLKDEIQKWISGDTKGDFIFDKCLNLLRKRQNWDSFLDLYPLPLVVPQWDKVSLNHFAYFALPISPSIGVISLGAGNASKPLGKSSLLNAIFKLNFESKSKSFLSHATIDMECRQKYPDSKLIVADCHGKLQPENRYLLKFFQHWIIHFTAKDMMNTENSILMEEISSFLEMGEKGTCISLLIRDANSCLPSPLPTDMAALGG